MIKTLSVLKIYGRGPAFNPAVPFCSLWDGWIGTKGHVCIKKLINELYHE